MLRSKLICLAAIIGGQVAATSGAFAGDWPTWRGPRYNGVSQETGLVDLWDPNGGPGSNLLWRNDALAGRSTPIVMGGKVFTIVRDRPATELEGEKIVCADAATGEIRWQHRFNVHSSDAPDTRVGRSLVVGDPATGRIYAQGVCGYFCCLEGDSGKVVWERSLHEEFGLLSTYNGRTNLPAPVVYGDTVITSGVISGWGDTPKWGLLAKPAHRFMAFDKATGELRWLSGARLFPHDTAYSSPTLTTLAGQPALVFGSGDGAVWALQAGTGKPLWRYPLSRRGLQVSPAVAPDGRVFAGHSEEDLGDEARGGLVALDGTKVGSAEPLDLADPEVGGESWKRLELTVGSSSPVFVDDRLFAITDTAEFLLIDPDSGTTIAQLPIGQAMRGSPLFADGKIYACSHNGNWVVLRRTEGPTPDIADDALEIVHRLSLGGALVDASPIAADGRVYLTTSETMYCLGAEESPSGPPASPAAVAPPEPTDKRVAQLQLVPCDALLSPGEEQNYRVRMYNSAGEFLREADPSDVSFGVSGPGEITNQGVYRAAADSGHDTALVLCEFKGMKGRGRVRVVPPPPWSFDFEDGAEEPPLAWIGGRLSYELRADDNGNHFLAKTAGTPADPNAPETSRGSRSRLWMGPHTLSGYTVRADIQLRQGVADEAAGGATADAAPTAEALPDVATESGLPSAGLINSGYTFALFGPTREARLYSWCNHGKRMQAAAPTPLEAGVWYRLKLTVSPADSRDSCTVQAKVWPAGKPEPGEWTLSFVDEAPNLQGSPGLFGDAEAGEVFVDNLTVTPN